MKVMWMTNTILPQIAAQIGRSEQYYIGWLSSLLDDILNTGEVELAVCFPDKGNTLVSGKADHLTFYGLPAWCSGEVYNEKVTEFLKGIVEEFQPDLLQVFGTEYPHTLSAVLAFGKPERTLAHIQGLISECAPEYCAGLPDNICRRNTLRDLIKRDNLYRQQEKFAQRGVWEVEAIRHVRHILGRTDWDRECTKKINPKVQYHHIGEGLRDSFYQHTWSLKQCERHAIFASQALYPLKGMHFLLEAMGQLKETYGDIHLYVTGKNKVFGTTFLEKLKVSSYNKYLHSLVRKFRLQEHVTFLGPANEEAMCRQYLKSHVFVSPSSIENSPNSVGEAMLLGMPVVCSDVGGVSSIVTDGKEGLLYAPYTDVDALASSIRRIFDNDALALELGQNARKRALVNYDREAICRDLLNVYRQILKCEE